jgi:NodT family efflux transporter outer membrane factor (OMF) lipoprotein
VSAHGWRHLPAISALALASWSCAVGPDFVRPEPPPVTAYTPGTEPKVLSPGAADVEQRVQVAAEISSAWWQLFRSPALDEVVKRALADNRDLAQARASLEQAREFVSAARGAFYPQVDASANGQYQAELERSGAHLVSQHGSSTYSVGATVSYLVDVFGGVRRNVEQQSALAERQRYELAAAWLTLTGNAVTQSVSIASLGAQIDAVEDVVADDARSLELVQRKYEAGKVARSDVLTASTQLASDQAQLPPLRQQLDAARHALSVLAGQAPATWSPPDFHFADFSLPTDLPLSLPSELVRQRPDILAAEADLHAASAAIGVATANMFPSFTLSGSLSLAESAAIFNGPGAGYSLAAQMLQPVFRGGTLRAQRRAAIDAYHASLAGYEQTVLVGFQQIADTLRALDHDAERLDAERRLLSTAEDALSLQRVLYDAGKIDLLDLLDAQRSYGQARLGFAQAQGQQLSDTAALYVGLGGGWWGAEI